MKKSIVSLTALSIALSAFTPAPMTAEKKSASTSQQMAEQVVDALRHTSSEEYASLFPTLDDFNGMMSESAEIYGSYLKEAQREFAGTYRNELYPSLRNSFESIVKDGKEMGIDWSTIRYVGIEVKEEPQQRFSPVPVTIVFSAKGVEHRINIEKALVINGKWKVSQFVTLI